MYVLIIQPIYQSVNQKITLVTLGLLENLLSLAKQTNDFTDDLDYYPSHNDISY